MRGAPVLWRSLRGEHRLALEIRQTPSDLGRLSAVVSALIEEQPDIAFLFLPIDEATDIDFHAIAETIGTLERLASARLCLAGRRDVLTRISSRIAVDQVGFMLDDVDAGTPLSELLWDRIEAVRFKQEFAERACHDVRQGCALNSMLLLCHDIGVCTLGLEVKPPRTSSTHRAGFDYGRTVPDWESLSMAHAGGPSKRGAVRAVRKSP